MGGDIWPFSLKVMSESRVTWASSVPILVSLGLSVVVLDLRQTSDRQQTGDRQKHYLMPPPIRGRGIISDTAKVLIASAMCIMLCNYWQELSSILHLLTEWFVHLFAPYGGNNFKSSPLFYVVLHFQVLNFHPVISCCTFKSWVFWSCISVPLRLCEGYKHEAQPMLTCPRDAFRGHARSSTLEPFDRMGMISCP